MLNVEFTGGLAINQIEKSKVYTKLGKLAGNFHGKTSSSLPSKGSEADLNFKVSETLAFAIELQSTVLMIHDNLPQDAYFLYVCLLA